RYGVAIQRQRSAQRLPVAREMPLPERVADNGSGRSASQPVVVGCDQPAQRRRYSQGAKEISADEQPFRELSFTATDQVELLVAPREDAGKGLLVLSHLI